MYTENGREKPADEKEYADLKGKRFRCTECSAEVFRKGVEFGEKPKCPTCGGTMKEKF